MIRKPAKLLRKRRLAPGVSRANPGSSPGVLHHTPLHLPTRVSVTAYGPEGFAQHDDVTDMDFIDQLARDWPVVWIAVNGLENIQLIEKIGEWYDLDKLHLEDVLDVGQRPKIEMNEHMIFSILKAVSYQEQIETEQVSMFVKKNVVIVFQEKSSQRFEQVRKRLRIGSARIRSFGADYLFYALLDEVIDRYFPILDKLNATLLEIEDGIFSEYTEAGSSGEQDTIRQIHHVKNDLLLLNRAIWPVIEMTNLLVREESDLITKPTRGFLKDCYDHSQQASELSQFYRDTAAGLLNTYLAYEGHKTNETVKVLTMISAVFIPLTLVASIFGMNFEHAYPAWDSDYGFLFALGLMGVLVAMMFGIFNRMGWLPRGLVARRSKPKVQDESTSPDD